MGLLRSLITEAVLSIIYIIGSFLGYLFPLRSLNPNPSQKRPIVFVHAWLSQNPPFILFKRFFERRGYRVYMTNFGWHLTDPEINAERLRRFMLDNAIEDVCLVGVSAGALISLYYLQSLDGWKRVHKFISIGGPFAGSPLAFLAAFISPMARQIMPGSAFLEKLRAQKIKHPNRIVCIFAKFDNLVPRGSSQLPGCKSIEVNIWGHVKMQLSIKTYRAVEMAIAD